MKTLKKKFDGTWRSKGSLLGPLLYKFFLTDLFLTINDKDIASYVDYNISYVVADYVDDLVRSWEDTSIPSFQCFDNYLLKLLFQIVSFFKNL